MQIVTAILKIVVWPSAAVIGLILFRRPLARLIYRFTESDRAKAKVSRDGLELEIGKQTDQALKAEPKAEQPEVERLKEEQERVPEQGIRELLSNVYRLLFTENNYREAQKVFYEEVEPKLNGGQKLLWHAVVLRESHRVGDASAFQKLETIVNENDTNPELIKQLALRYKQMGEFEKAKEKFLHAEKHYDINDEAQRESAVDCYIQASSCLAGGNDYSSATHMLKQILAKPELEGQKAKILSAMAYMAKDEDLLEDFLCYAEASLSADPLDTDLRFNAAYAYSNMGYEKLALLHYKKLIGITTSPIALNNLGVCYGNLKLNGKSIASYLRSAEEKETVAMANLAYNYLDAGFVNDARELIDGANKLSTEGIQVNPRVGSASRKLQDLQEQEDKTEKRLLKEARQEREFRLQYSEATLSDRSIAKDDWEAPWETPWGEAKIELNQASNSFQIKLHTKEEDKWASAFLPSLGLLRQQKVYKDRYIVIDGTIRGLTGRYRIQIDDTQQTSLLTAGKLYSATGYMIINDSCDRVQIMEKTSDDKTELREWKRLGSKDRPPGVGPEGHGET